MFSFINLICNQTQHHSHQHYVEPGLDLDVDQVDHRGEACPSPLPRRSPSRRPPGGKPYFKIFFSSPSSSHCHHGLHQANLSNALTSGHWGEENHFDWIQRSETRKPFPQHLISKLTRLTDFNMIVLLVIPHEACTDQNSSNGLS